MVSELRHRRCTCRATPLGDRRTLLGGGNTRNKTSYAVYFITRTRRTRHGLWCLKVNHSSSSARGAVAVAVDVPEDMAEYTKKLPRKFDGAKNSPKSNRSLKLNGWNQLQGCRKWQHANSYRCPKWTFSFGKISGREQLRLQRSKWDGQYCTAYGCSLRLFWCAKLLREQGNADVTIKNNDGHVALVGSRVIKRMAIGFRP